MIQTNEAREASKTPALNDGRNVGPKLLLRIGELARILSVSERTIQYWLTEKRIPCLRLSPRLNRFSLPKVEAALARYEVKEIGRAR